MPSEISLDAERSVVDPSAEAHERRVEGELTAQFIELGRQARGRFEVVKGRRGAYSEEYWEEAFRKAKVTMTAAASSSNASGRNATSISSWWPYSASFGRSSWTGSRIPRPGTKCSPTQPCWPIATSCGSRAG